VTAPADPITDEVQEYRNAAREVARAPGRTHRDKLKAFVSLSELARESEAPDLCQRAVWVEFDAYLHGVPTPPVGPDPVENACRGLRREGYERCPSCRRRLPDETEMDRWRRLREHAIAEARRFEEAAS
jgi:hypothetical protein